MVKPPFLEPNSPFRNFVGDNRNTLMGFWAGMTGAPNIAKGAERGMQFAMQGRPLDLERKDKREAEAQQAQQVNQTVEYLKRNAPDLAEMVATGGLKPSDALNEAMMRSRPQKPDPTSAQKNYEFLVAQGMDPGKALERAFSGGVNVNVGQSEYGTIPQGFELFTDPETGVRRMQPIPGGPAAAEAAQAAEAAETKQSTAERYGNVVIEDIDRALEKIEANPGMTTGIIGSGTQGAPGFPAHDVNKLITTVKANAGFDRLQAMRDASPTGGALGQVSERELDFLNSAIGNLEQSQSAEQLITNLKRVRRIYNEIIHGTDTGNGNTTGTGISWSIE